MRVRLASAVAVAVAAVAIGVASCSAPRTVTTSAATLRTDTFRAVLAEQLHVCLDDVVIIPPDSVRPMLLARHVELRRQSDASISSRTAERTDSTAIVEQSPPTSSPRTGRSAWLLMITAIAAYILGARRRQ